MKKNNENKFYLEQNYNQNKEFNDNNIFTDSDNEEFFKKNEDIKNLTNKNDTNNN